MCEEFQIQYHRLLSSEQIRICSYNIFESVLQTTEYVIAAYVTSREYVIAVYVTSREYMPCQTACLF